MTGNEQAPFRQTFQGPRGIPSDVHGVPFPRRRRRPHIDLQAVDARARAENAKREAERARLLRENPEAAKVLEEEAQARRAAEEAANAAKGPPANDSDHPSNAAKTLEMLEQADKGKGAFQGAVEDDPIPAPGPPVSSPPAEVDTPPPAPDPDGQEPPETSETPSAKKAAKKKSTPRKRARSKTTTIQT